MILKTLLMFKKKKNFLLNKLCSSYMYSSKMHVECFHGCLSREMVYPHFVFVKISRSIMAIVAMLPVIGSILNRPLMLDDWIEYVT